MAVDPTALATARSFTLNNSAGNLDITGNGNLAVSGLAAAGSGVVQVTNSTNYTGTTTVSDATLDFATSASHNGVLGNTSAISLYPGGELLFDNTNGSVNRLPGAAPMSINGGTLADIVYTTGGTQALGVVSFLGGNNAVTVTAAGSAGGLVFSNSYNRSAGAVVSFTSSANNYAQIPGQAAGPLGAWAISGTDFAKLDANHNVLAFAASDYAATDLGVALWSSTANVRLNASNPTLTANTSINSLNSSTTASLTLGLGTNLLNIYSGGLLSSSGTNTFTITGGTSGGLTAGGATGTPGELVLVPAVGTLTVNAAIHDNGSGGTVTLTKGGSGTLNIGPNTFGTPSNDYSGATYLSGGTVNLGKWAFSLSVPGNLTINGAAVNLTTNGQIGDSANVSIVNFANAGSLATGALFVNETIGTLTVNSFGGSVLTGNGNLNLSASGAGGYALNVTGGTIAAPVSLSAATGGNIQYVAPPVTLAPPATTNWGPYTTTFTSVLNLNIGLTPVVRTINVAKGPDVIDLAIGAISTAANSSYGSGNDTNPTITSWTLAGIDKTGPGTLQLNGENFFYGGLTVDGGMVDLNTARDLKPNLVTVNAGGTLNWDVNEASYSWGDPRYLSVLVVNGGTIQMNNQGATNATVQGDGGTADRFAQLKFLSGTFNAPVSSVLDLAAYNNGVTLVLNGNTLNGRFDINNTNEIVQTLPSANTAVIAGQLKLDAMENFNVPAGTTSSGVDLDIQANLNGSGFFKIGTGVMQLSGTGVSQQNTQNGDIRIAQGTLILNKNIPGIVGAAIPNGNNIWIGNNATTAAMQWNYDQEIVNTANLFVATGSTLNLNGHNQAIANLNLGGVSSMNQGAGNWQGTLPGGLVTSSGSTTLQVTYLRLDGGTVSLGANSRIMYDANGFEGGSAGGVAPGVINNPFVMQTGQWDNVNGWSVNYNVYNLVGQGATSGTADVTFNAPISGPFGLWKSGYGTMVLNASNSFTGEVRVQDGMLTITNSAALPAGTAVYLDGNGDSRLNLNGYNVSLAYLQNGGNGGGYVYLGNGGQLTLGSGGDLNGNNSGTAGFQGAIFGGTTVPGTFTLTKTGDGVQDFSGGQEQWSYVGNTLIAGGILRLTGANALPFATNVTINPGATLDLWQNSSAIGGLTGNGTVLWGENSQTLTVGYNNASSTFGGTLTTPLSTAITNSQNPGQMPASFMNLTKIGSGNLAITSNTSTAGGNLNVYAGTLTLSGNGQLGFLTNTVYPTGNLVLDDTAGNQPNSGFRLGLNNLNLQQGNFLLKANAAGTTEMINQLQFNVGVSTVTLDATTNATTGPTVLQVPNLAAIQAGGSGLIRGSNLGGAPGPGVANIYVNLSAMNGTYGGGTTDNTPTISIRPDLLGDTSITGSGTGFIVRDPMTGFLRPLGSQGYTNELTSNFYAGANYNVQLSSAVQFSATAAASPAQTLNSLTLQSGGGVNTGSSFWTLVNYAPTQNDVRVQSGGLLAFPSNAGISGNGVFDTNGQSFYVHAQGNVTLSSLYGNNNASNLVKDGSGTLTITQPQWFNNQIGIYVNAGTLVMAGSQTNMIPLTFNAGSGIATLAGNDVYVNAGATLDMQGNSQVFRQLNGNAADYVAGTAGTITNTTGGPVNLTIRNDQNNSVFSGTITDTVGNSLSLIAGGGNGKTLTFTNSTNNYTGSTVLPGGTFTLQQLGALTQTSAVTVNYGTLNLDDSQLYVLGNARLPGQPPITLQGGTFAYTAAPDQAIPGGINTVNLNTVTVPRSLNNINANGQSSTNATLTIQNLAVSGVGTQGMETVVNFGGNNLGYGIASTGAVAAYSNYMDFQNPVYNRSHIFVTNFSVNGTPIVSSGTLNSPLTNGILGAWAIANGGDWATYSATQGIGAGHREWQLSRLLQPRPLRRRRLRPRR